MATEKLKFKISLSPIMWDRPPHAEILLNGKSYFKDDISDTRVIEFQADIEEGKESTLTIKRSGKGKNQTIVNDKGDILKDQLLEIKHIEIDEIDIGGLVFEGTYRPIYPEPWATQQREAGVELKESFDNVTKMGHDGDWTFKFGSPFYMWLLENLY